MATRRYKYYRYFFSDGCIMECRKLTKRELELEESRHGACVKVETY